MVEKRCFNIFNHFFLGGGKCFHSSEERTGEERERSNMKKILKTALFGHILKKISRSTF